MSARSARRRPARALLAGFVLWNVALVGLSAWLADASERSHPPIGRFVEIEGRQVHLHDSGPPPRGEPDAPALVLLHGASTSLLDFGPSLRGPLAERFRVVSIDRPGHGYSDVGERWPDPYAQARLARAALETLGIERAVWIGHSWAGAVVLAALLEEPGHALGAVLIAGVSHPWEGGSAWHAELAARPLLGRAFAWQYVETVGRAMLEPAVASAFAPEPVPEGYVEATALTLSLRPPTYRANARDLTRLSAHLERQARRYGEIAHPVLSLVGDADDVVPARNHDHRLAAVLPAFESVTLAGAGHAFHHTRTERVVALIERFVTALPHAARAAGLP